MKLITEVDVRRIVKEGISDNIFEISSDSLLTPAAKDYLSNHRMKVVVAGKGKGYINSYTKQKLVKKPEFMTHLSDNVLVDKDDNRIMFRGKLDSLQAEILDAMIVAERNDRKEMLSFLKEVLDYVRTILRAEVLDESLPDMTLFGYDDAGLRDRSHNAMKYYHVKVLQLPDIAYGELYIKMNLVRCRVRETELSAVTAFKRGEGVFFERKDIIQALNRLSSGMHILMCEEIVLNGQ